MALTRAGADEMLREAMRTHIHPPVECWNAAGAWACIAEAAAATDHQAEAAHALDGLAHSSGGMAIMGYSVHYGPTDGYRALALATLGRTDEARSRIAGALTRFADLSSLRETRLANTLLTRL